MPIEEQDLRLSVAKNAGGEAFLRTFGDRPESKNILNDLNKRFGALSPEQMQDLIIEIANNGYVGRSVYDNGLGFFKSDTKRSVDPLDSAVNTHIERQKAINPHSVDQRQLLLKAADDYLNAANAVMESEDVYKSQSLEQEARNQANSEKAIMLKQKKYPARPPIESKFSEPEALERITTYFKDQIPNPENEVYVNRINSLLSNVTSEQGLERAGAYIFAAGRDKIGVDTAREFLQKLPKIQKFVETHPGILEHGEQAQKFPSKEQKSLIELEDRLKTGDLNPTKKGKPAFSKFFNNRIVSDEGTEKAILLIREAGEKAGTVAQTEELLKNIPATDHYITQNPQLHKEIPATTNSLTTANEEVATAIQEPVTTNNTVTPTPSVNPIIPLPTPTAAEEAAALAGLTEFFTKNQPKPSLKSYV